MEDLQAVQTKRFKFLRILYEHSERNENARFSIGEIAVSLGLTNNDAIIIVQYLEREGLIKLLGRGGWISLTHTGLLEVEKAMSSPKEGTEHFPAGTTVNIGAIHGSQVQLGTTHSTQSGIFTFATNDLTEIRKIIDAIEQDLTKMQGLSTDDIQAANLYVGTVRNGLSLTNPNPGFIKTALISLKDVLAKQGAELAGSVGFGLLKGWLASKGITT